MRGATLVLAALACAGCAGPPPPRTTAELEPGLFTIGYAAVSARDLQLVRSAQLAVEEINARGGVEGAVRLELVVAEEGGEPADIARRLVLRGVQALVLACDPAAQRAQADVADRTQVLAVAPCNEDPAVAERYGAVWPVSLGANAEAAAMADHALAERYEAFRPVDLWPQMARYVEQAAQSRRIRVDEGAPVLGTHRSEAGGLADGAAFTTYGFPSEGSVAAEFYERYERRFGREPAGSWIALGYDAVQVLATAMAAAGDPDPAALSERLGVGLTVQGALGEIVYPGSGEHQPETAVAVVRVENGKRVLVEKSLPEDVPAP